MKKIMFISDYSFKVPGGAQKSMEIIMKGLSDKYEFYVVMPGKKYDCSNEKYKCIFIEKYENLLVNDTICKTLYLLKTLCKIIKEVNPDIIHVHMVSGMNIIEILKLLGLVKCELVYTERGVADQYSKATRFIIKKMCKNFSKVITTTNYNKQLYSSLYNIKEDKIDVIPNTAGYIFERKMTYFNKKSNNLKIMFNARLTYNKNWDLSLDIMKWLSENYDVDFIVVIGTDTSEQDIQKFNELSKRILSNIKTRNCYIKRDLSLEDINKLYMSSDIFIMTSRSESFGRTAIEAMARKNVVFGSNIDGLAEVISFKEYLFYDFDDFKDKFMSFKTKNMEKEKEKFYNRFLMNYSLEINLNSYNKLYEKLLRKEE